MSRFGRLRAGGRRVREAYGGVYRKGGFDVGEYVGYLLYLIFALTAFGLMASDVTTAYPALQDFCAVGVIGSGIFVFFKGKEKKQNRHWTAVEIITLGIAVVVPIAMVWNIPGLDIATYIDTVEKKLFAFLVCMVCLYVSAKQD